MEATQSVQTAIIDVALAETTVEDDDVLQTLCDEHVRVTRQAIRDPPTLLDWPEQLEAVRAL